MFIVYKATNRENGKSYIGITSRTAEVRWEEHLSRARCGMRRSRLYDAIRKYGDSAFDLEVVAAADSEDEARTLECHYINEFDTYESGYNCNFGGAGFLKFPAHIIEKISAAQKGKIISDETKRKMSLAKLGDSSCANNFGDHVKKGCDNPRSKQYLIGFPDGSERIVIGLRAFCREMGLDNSKLMVKGRTKGYKILRRFNDHPERE